MYKIHSVVTVSKCNLIFNIKGLLRLKFQLPVSNNRINHFCLSVSSEMKVFNYKTFINIKATFKAFLSE